MRKFIIAAAATALGTTLALGSAIADTRISQSSVNKSIRVEANTASGDIDSVNGSIDIGANARVGRIESVNGSIRLGDGSEAEALESVNGTIRLGENVAISGNLETVNGGVRTEPGTQIGGNLSTVNGMIELEGALVEGDLVTYNGTIRLTGTVVAGSLHVKKPSNGWSWGKKRQKPVRVEIGPGTTIRGDLYFDRPVELKLSDDAVVGKIHGDEVETFAR